MDMSDKVSSFCKPLNNHPFTESTDLRISKRCHGYTDFNTVDAVILLNSKIDIALEQQRVSIVSESQSNLKVNTDFKGEDKHGSDTAKEYTDSDIADNAEDATKLRYVVARAATEKRQNQTPYSRNQPPFTKRKATMQLSQSGFRQCQTLNIYVHQDLHSTTLGPTLGQVPMASVSTITCQGILLSTAPIQSSYNVDNLPQQLLQKKEIRTEQVEYILYILYEQFETENNTKTIITGIHS